MHPLFDFSYGERRAILLLMGLTFVVSVWRVYKATQPAEVVPLSEVVTDSLSIPVAGDTLVEVVDKSSISSVETVKSLKETTVRKGQVRSGAVVALDLNRVDSLDLQKVSGLGPVLSARIVKYRNLLGGFCSIEQLLEVYGIDEIRYEKIVPYLTVEEPIISRISVNESDYKTLLRHPYITKEQVQRIWTIRKEKRIVSWNELLEYKEFDDRDIARLTPYFTF